MEILFQAFIILAALVASACAEGKADPQWITSYVSGGASPLVYAPAYVQPQPQPAVVYHTHEEANCHVEYEIFKTEHCEPKYDIVCEKERHPSQTIDLKKVCKPIVDVMCGMQEPVEQPAAVVEGETATAAYPASAVPYIVANVAKFYHHCHDVTRDYCYVVPVIREVNKQVDSCYVVTKANCRDTVRRVAKTVCNHDPADIAAAEAAAAAEPVVAVPAQVVDNSVVKLAAPVPAVPVVYGA